MSKRRPLAGRAMPSIFLLLPDKTAPVELA